MPKIIGVEFCKRMGRTAVMAEFSDGSIEDVIYFYDDELTFSKSEFVGLTSDQAGELHYKRDVAYLRS